MNDTDLYRQILGIEEPWYVVEVKLDLPSESVRVYLEYRKATKWTCPTCGAPASVHDHRDEREWRHLDSCQLKTYIVAKPPRVKCSKHGVLMVPVPWSELGSRFTQMFERFAIDVLQATGVQVRAAQLLRLSAGQVRDVMRRAVERGQRRRDRDQPVAHVSLDEKGFKRRHQFVTVLGDLCGRRVLDVEEGHTTKAAEKLLKQGLSETQRKAVKSVSMDMWFPFQHARERVLPGADTVHDRFHIGKFLNEAVDRTRRSESRELRRKHDPSLLNTRYVWLRDPSKMTEKQRADLQKLEGLELETAKVWAFKESFRQFFDFETQSEATAFFDTWHDAARALGNIPLTLAAKTLKDHFQGLISYIRHKVTNAFAEAINGQIQRIKANARGYRTFQNFRIAILFFLGKMDMYPHKSP